MNTKHIFKLLQFREIKSCNNKSGFSLELCFENEDFVKLGSLKVSQYVEILNNFMIASLLRWLPKIWCMTFFFAILLNLER